MCPLEFNKNLLWKGRKKEKLERKSGGARENQQKKNDYNNRKKHLN